MSTFDEARIGKKGVRTDWIDLRDQHYMPNLSVLRSSISMDAMLLCDDESLERTNPRKPQRIPIFGVRDQGESGRCVGYALANLIDIQSNLQKLRQFHAEVIDDVDSNDEMTEEEKAKEEALRLERKAKRNRQDIVSADMLYRMAFFHDRYPDLEDEATPTSEGIRTLRSAIKGFYHHGVCLDWPEGTPPEEPGRWQSECYSLETPDKGLKFPRVEQAKMARNIGLGAYFRLSSVLNHFHAALNDAEAVLASANIHMGWLQATPENGGVIPWPWDGGKVGTHAFVIVGYDREGFHVLNSWGPEWGGYKGQAGIALWSYKDWAQNVVDSWVLRLGVHAPDAFGASIGEKGTKGVTSRVQVGSTPCSELVGHYMHLDDGFHVATGSYPAFKNGWDKTHKYLMGNTDPNAPVGKDEKTYRGILVWIPGSLEGIKPAFASAVQRKNQIKALGLYPYTIFWCNNFVEKSMEVMKVIFDSCEAQAGSDAAHLDELIESRVRGVGRAFWRDIELGARRALRGTGELPFEPDEEDKLSRIKKGFVGTFLKDLMDLKDETGCEIHVVAEGASALIVHEMLALVHDDAENLKNARDCTCDGKKGVPYDSLFDGREAKDYFDTLHLIHPAIGMPRACKRLQPFVNELNKRTFEDVAVEAEEQAKRDASEVQPMIASDSFHPARIYLPTKALEERISFGVYGKSILHLVSRSFEDRYAPPSGDKDDDIPIFRPVRTFLGMASVVDHKDFTAGDAVYLLDGVTSQKHDLDRVPQDLLTNDSTITDAIYDSIRTYQKKNS